MLPYWGKIKGCQRGLAAMMRSLNIGTRPYWQKIKGYQRGLAATMHNSNIGILPYWQNIKKGYRRRLVAMMHSLNMGVLLNNGQWNKAGLSGPQMFCCSSIVSSIAFAKLFHDHTSLGGFQLNEFSY
jgi:hypothetical protein